MSAENNRQAAEALACADALRSIRVALYRRMVDDHLLPEMMPHARVILVEGHATIDALEKLAERIGAK
jgi:hypothetical protein